MVYFSLDFDYGDNKLRHYIGENSIHMSSLKIRQKNFVQVKLKNLIVVVVDFLVHFNFAVEPEMHFSRHFNFAVFLTRPRNHEIFLQ